MEVNSTLLIISDLTNHGTHKKNNSLHTETIYALIYEFHISEMRKKDLTHERLTIGGLYATNSLSYLHFLWVYYQRKIMKKWPAPSWLDSSVGKSTAPVSQTSLERLSMTFVFPANGKNSTSAVRRLYAEMRRGQF